MRTLIVSILLSASTVRAWGQSDEVRVATDKPIYTTMEFDPVKITVINDSPRNVLIPNAKWRVLKGSKVVYAPISEFLETVPAGKSGSLVWDKKTNTGAAAAGSYTIEVGPMFITPVNIGTRKITVALTPTGMIAGNRMSGTSWFPLSVGDEWRYVATTKTGASVTAAMKVTNHPATSKWYRVTNLVGAGRWASLSGAVKPALFVTSTPSSGSAGVSLFRFKQAVKYAYKVQLPPLLTMVQMKVGSTNETVATPAGTFKNCYRLNATPAGWGAGVSYWFAPGVGLVQYIEWKATTGVKLYRLHHAKIKGSDAKTYTIGQ